MLRGGTEHHWEQWQPRRARLLSRGNPLPPRPQYKVVVCIPTADVCVRVRVLRERRAGVRVFSLCAGKSREDEARQVWEPVCPLCRGVSQEALREDNGEDCNSPREAPSPCRCCREGRGANPFIPTQMGRCHIGRGEVCPWEYARVPPTSNGIKPGCSGQNGTPWTPGHLDASASCWACYCLNTKTFISPVKIRDRRQP